MLFPTFASGRRAAQPTSPRSRHARRSSVWLAGAVAFMGFALSGATLAPELNAQTGSVTGQIVSNSGQNLDAVQVSLEGTGLGTITNAAGRYLILNVPAGQYTVAAELIGYGRETQTVTVTAGSSSVVDFTLRDRAVALDGVVVTGTPIAAQQREIGNSIALITAEDIIETGATTVDEVLRGRTPGLTIQGTSGQAGSGSNVVLRGLTSVNGRNQPLIYVDGVRINDQGTYEAAGEAQVNATVLNSIDPEQIERIEVIKGAAASTLYGSEAGAGVIQIFTKGGAVGPATWSFSSTSSLATPPHVGPDSDPTGLHVNDCTANGPIPSDTTVAPDPGCPASGSWLRNAFSQDYQLSVRGGAEDFSYFASAGWERQEGIVNVPEQYDPQNSQNFNLRANFSFDAWENFSIRFNNSYSRRDIRWIPDGDNLEGLLFNVTFLDQGETPGNDDSRVFEMDIQQDIDHFTTSTNINWTPSDNFQHRINAGLDWTNSNQRTDRPFLFWAFEDGDRTVDIENSRIITLDYAGSWAWQAGDNWRSTFSWGGQFVDREELGLRGDCEGFVGPGAKLTENCRDITNLNEDRFGFKNGGVFLQEQIGWANRFFVTAGARLDNHSSFGDDLALDQSFVVYPKAQATYTLSDHDFWPTFFETARLRVAWGESGEPPPPDASKSIWNIAGADANEQGFIVGTVGNPEIGPERTSEVELGFDAGLFDGRVALQTTYFNRQTTDGIIFVDLPASNGLFESLATNVGSWESRGFEAAVDVFVIDGDDFSVNLNGSYQYIDTEMKEFGADEDNSLNVGFNNRFKIGDPFPSTYGNRVINPDEVGVLPERSDTLEFQGQTRPPHEVSFGASVAIGDRLTLDAFGIGQFGHVLLDDQAQELAAEGLWPDCVDIDQQVEAWFTGGRPEGGLSPLTAGQIAQCSRRYAANEDWVFDADFFRIQSLSASYRLPESWLPGALQSAVVQLRANNVALFTDYPGSDPDALLQPATQVLRRASGYTLPLPRTYSFNLRVTF